MWHCLSPEVPHATAFRSHCRASTPRSTMRTSALRALVARVLSPVISSRATTKFAVVPHRSLPA